MVRDPAEVDRLLGVMGGKNPMVSRFVPIPKQEDGHYDPDRLGLAIQHGFCIVRWRAHDDARAKDTDALRQDLRGRRSCGQAPRP